MIESTPCPFCGGDAEIRGNNATDDERREVARRLRGDPCDTLIPYRTGVHFSMGCHEAANRFWDMCERIKLAGDYDIAYSTRSVLADLIEPHSTIPTDPGEAGLASVEGFIREMRHSTEEEQNEYRAMLEKQSVELHPVDRDALLALADEMDADASRGDTGTLWTGGCQELVRDYAARIREVCGEAS